MQSNHFHYLLFDFFNVPNVYISVVAMVLCIVYLEQNHACIVSWNISFDGEIWLYMFCEIFEGGELFVM